RREADREKNRTDRHYRAHLLSAAENAAAFGQKRKPCRAEAEIVAGLQRRRIPDAVSVEKGSVGRFEICYRIASEAAPNHRVVARNRGLVDYDVVVFGAADRGLAGLQLVHARLESADSDQPCLECATRYVVRSILRHPATRDSRNARRCGPPVRLSA